MGGGGAPRPAAWPGACPPGAAGGCCPDSATTVAAITNAQIDVAIRLMTPFLLCPSTLVARISGFYSGPPVGWPANSRSRQRSDRFTRGSYAPLVCRAGATQASPLLRRRGGIRSEEGDRHEPESRCMRGHHRPVLWSRQMQDRERIPEHDVAIDDRPVAR